MGTIIGGHRYYVDSSGNIFKNDKFVPAENFKYLPSSVIDTAKEKKSSGVIVSAPGATSNTPTASGKVTSGGNGTVSSGTGGSSGNGAIGGGGVVIVPSQLGSTVTGGVQAAANNFGFTAIVGLGVAFLAMSVLTSFRRVRR
jgi:hypothetical protein